MSNPTVENLKNAVDEFLKHPNAATCWSLFCLADRMDDPLADLVKIVRSRSYKKTFPQIKSLLLETINELVNMFDEEEKKLPKVQEFQNLKEVSVNERKS